MLEKILEVVSNSSIPGFARISHFSTRRAQTGWILLIFTGFICFCIHVSYLTIRFNRRETVTEATINLAPTLFPDITICNKYPLNWHRSQATARFEGQNMSLRVFTRQIKAFWKAALNISLEKLNKYTRADNPYFRKTLDTFVTDFNLSHNLDEMVMTCQYRGKNCSKDEFVSFHFPKYQRCFTFRPNNRQASQLGPKNGLRLLIYAADRRAFLTDEEIINWLRGISVIVHEPFTAPLVKDSNNIAVVGKYTILEFSTVKSIQLSRKSHRCAHDGDEPPIKLIRLDSKGKIADSQKYPYSQEICQELIQQKQFVKTCGCLSEQHVTDWDSLNRPFCHQIDPKAITDVVYTLRNGSVYVNASGEKKPFLEWNHRKTAEILNRQNCYEHISRQQQELGMNETKRCPARCTTNMFTIYTTSYDWPDSVANSQGALKRFMFERMKTMKDPETYQRSIDRKYLESLEKIRFTFLRVDVFPKSKHGTLIREQEAYPLSAFFSDFGGILGFWLGMSIITIVEIVSSCLLYKRQIMMKAKSIEPTSTQSTSPSAPSVKSNWCEDIRY